MPSASRALVVFADRHAYLIHQARALYESLLEAHAEDTELVCFGPSDALSQLPCGPLMRKVEQQPHPRAAEYPFINSLACFNGPGSDCLEAYASLLKTDVDTFVTSAWVAFRPTGFLCGRGAYVHSQDVRDRLIRVSAELGLAHRGWHNLGSTLLGPAAAVREVCAMATEITVHLLDHHFAVEQGRWPEWFRGVSSMYATEIALNHSIAGLIVASEHLDFPSHKDADVQHHPHIHCWQTIEHYSKLNWIDGLYVPRPESELRLDRVPDYCFAMSQRAARRVNGGRSG